MRAFFLRASGGIFDMLRHPCHSRGVVRYTIVPRGRGYWIIAKGNNGVRHPLERYETGDEAVRRLRELQNVADTGDHCSAAEKASLTHMNEYSIETDGRRGFQVSVTNPAGEQIIVPAFLTWREASEWVEEQMRLEAAEALSRRKSSLH
jgi:hypothetical protein